MGSIPVEDSDISLSHARVMLINLSITFHYQAQNQSPSSFTYQRYLLLKCILGVQSFSLPFSH